MVSVGIHVCGVSLQLARLLCCTWAADLLQEVPGRSARSGRGKHKEIESGTGLALAWALAWIGCVCGPATWNRLDGGIMYSFIHLYPYGGS